MGELLFGLYEYFAFYNGERPHQSLGNKTPDEVYRTATATATATAKTTTKAKPGQRRPAASEVEWTS